MTKNDTSSGCISFEIIILFHFISFHFISFQLYSTVHKAVENVTKAICDIDVLKVWQNLFGQPSYLNDISGMSI